MRIGQALALSVAAAFASAGCEYHEHERGDVGVRTVVTDEPQAAVIDGGVAIDVEPDPAQRVYVYDEGYPPGTYIYNDYYYYGGYRYPRDVFVNRYVQDNVRQHRYANRDDNRRQGQQIEQRQRADFGKNHGARQAPAERAAEQPRQVQQPNVQHPENRIAPPNDRPANVERPKEERPANVERPKEERPANVERPENRPPAKEERHVNGERPENKAAPAKEERKPEEKREEKENK